jgi:hypothetical protein
MHFRDADTIRILSFNCLAVPFAGAPDRLHSLGALVAAFGYELVLLQEIQLRRYLSLVRRFFREYPHLAYEPGWHAPRGGLVTLSTLSPLRKAFVAFHEQGPVFGPTIADRILGKGMLRTDHKHGDVSVAVINTHLLANYHGDWRRGSRVMLPQILQVKQLARVVNAIASDTLVIVGGDFNLPRGGHVMQSLLKETGLHDALAENATPTYRPGGLMPRSYAQPIDAVLVRCPTSLSVRTAARVRFPKPVVHRSGRTSFLSDHLAVEVVLNLKERAGPGTERLESGGA